MKKIFSLLLLALSLTAFSQAEITEGVVISKQTMSSDNEQVSAQFAMIGDIATTTYFKGNKSRSETSNEMSGKTVTIIDGDSKEMIVSMDNQMLGKKYVTKSTVLSEQDLDNVEILEGDETRTILGYECQEYNITVVKEGVTINMVMYATNKLSAISQQATMLGSEFSSFPLFMTMNMSQMGMNMTITHEVTEIKEESVSSEKFDMTPPEGYEKTDQLQGM